MREIYGARCSKSSDTPEPRIFRNAAEEAFQCGDSARRSPNADYGEIRVALHDAGALTTRGLMVPRNTFGVELDQRSRRADPPSGDFSRRCLPQLARDLLLET